MSVETIHLSMLLEFLAGCSALFLLRRADEDGSFAPPSVRLLFATLAVATLTAVCKMGVMQRYGLDFFGLLHVIYLDLVVIAPALGAIGILDAAWRRIRTRKRWSQDARLAAWGLVGCAFVGVYASWIEPRRLQVEHASRPLRAAVTGTTTVRLAVLADLQTDHVTDYEHEAVSRLLELKPDVILIPGDFFQASREEFERELPALRSLASRLTAPFGVYFALGNTDGSQHDLERIFSGTEVQILVDEIADVTVRDRQLQVFGIHSRWDTPGALQALKEFETGAEDGAVRIVLTHYPDVVYELAPQSRVDLVVAGHTHGGQVQVPFLGPPIVLSKVPRYIGAGGLHVLDGRALYISRGVGMERHQAPRIRFFCPPEVALIELGS